MLAQVAWLATGDHEFSRKTLPCCKSGMFFILGIYSSSSHWEIVCLKYQSLGPSDNKEYQITHSNISQTTVDGRNPAPAGM